ncbi:hypothetical protein TNCV_783331 [Trichonephila clavipes]|nr:hypothetical protein TNCV_783331 [Trichonephila clavipes]
MVRDADCCAVGPGFESRRRSLILLSSSSLLGQHSDCCLYHSIEELWAEFLSPDNDSPSICSSRIPWRHLKFFNQPVLALRNQSNRLISR